MVEREREPTGPISATEMEGREAGFADGGGVFIRTGTEQPVPDANTISTTDPDAVWARKSGPATPAYFDNYLVDTPSRVILGVEATPALFLRRR
jgi:hypothetical protein